MNEIALTPNFRWIARIGYLARGVVYLVIGGLALIAALGRGGQTTGSRGALLEVLEQPFGHVMLVALIIGLFCYSTWRIIQAFKDPDNHGSSPKGLVVRGALFVSAVTHAFLAVWAIPVLIGQGVSAGGGQGEGFLTTDLGQVILTAVGVAAIGAGLAHIYKGWTARFERYMEIPGEKIPWARPVCRFGLIARGFVWCLVGWFLIQSSLLFNSGDVKGMSDALSNLRGSSYGPWLLGVTAIGLFSFGVYSILEAIYRRIAMNS